MRKAKLLWHFLAMICALYHCFAVSAGLVESRTRGEIHDLKAKAGKWCIAKPSTDNVRLKQNINYSCQQKGVDCGPIQPGGSCFLPNTAISHASYVMNLYYKTAGKHTWDCHFNGTGMIISQDPSYGAFHYPF